MASQQLSAPVDPRKHNLSSWKFCGNSTRAGTPQYSSNPRAGAIPPTFGPNYETHDVFRVKFRHRSGRYNCCCPCSGHAQATHLLLTLHLVSLWSKTETKFV